LLKFVVELLVIHVNAQRNTRGIIRGRTGVRPSAEKCIARRTVPLWQLSDSTKIRTPLTNCFSAAKARHRSVRHRATPRFVEAVRLKIVPRVRHLAAVPE
jgi:hypothetical protein